MSLPVVAIVGAPNVGKSSLFNRLIGERRSIVTDEPGVTRDRLYGDLRDSARPFRLVDTGGLDPGSAAPMAREIEGQAEAALDEAALILFVVDARAGATAVDEELARLLRRRGLPLLLVANKADSARIEDDAQSLYALGLGDPLPVSAEHGRGLEELVESVERCLGEQPAQDAEPAEDDAPLRLAVVGKPNVGKSSLVNRLLGQERVLVSEIPGTTRDSVDTALTVDGQRFVLVDTAGIRRSGRVDRGVERFSVQRARDNIDRCDVAALVLDGSEPLTAQDAHIAGYVLDSSRPMVVVVNKWDRVEDREDAVRAWRETLEERLRFAPGVPVVFVSARTGQRVGRVLDDAIRLHAAAGIEVPTPALNRWLRRQPGGDPSAPPPHGGLRLFYAVQRGVRPPRFLVFCNDPRRVHFSFRRRLQNDLRASFDFDAVPLKLAFRARRAADEN